MTIAERWLIATTESWKAEWKNEKNFGHEMWFAEVYAALPDQFDTNNFVMLW